MANCLLPSVKKIRIYTVVKYVDVCNLNLSLTLLYNYSIYICREGSGIEDCSSLWLGARLCHEFLLSICGFLQSILFCYLNRNLIMGAPTGCT